MRQNRRFIAGPGRLVKISTSVRTSSRSGRRRRVETKGEDAAVKPSDCSTGAQGAVLVVDDEGMPPARHLLKFSGWKAVAAIIAAVAVVTSCSASVSKPIRSSTSVGPSTSPISVELPTIEAALPDQHDIRLTAQLIVPPGVTSADLDMAKIVQIGQTVLAGQTVKDLTTKGAAGRLSALLTAAVTHAYPTLVSKVLTTGFVLQ
jgi:hypothetical protein